MTGCLVGRILVALTTTFGLTTGPSAGQTPAGLQEVEVWLNGKRLAIGHAHLARTDDPRAGSDEGCIEHQEIARLLGGAKYLEHHGSILEAIALGSGRGAPPLRVQRCGVSSTRLHRTGDRQYIPLADFARALGAEVVVEKAGRVTLVLSKRRGSPTEMPAILAPNY